MSTAALPLSKKLQAIGASFTPTRGAVGSTYALSMGNAPAAFYTRTPWGNLRVRPEVGMSLVFRQNFIKRHQQFILLGLLVVLAVLVAL
jgi:hypothetical protein